MVNCGTCGAPLRHINEACDNCLPGFNASPRNIGLELAQADAAHIQAQREKVAVIAEAARTYAALRFMFSEYRASLMRFEKIANGSGGRGYAEDIAREMRNLMDELFEGNHEHSYAIAKCREAIVAMVSDDPAYPYGERTSCDGCLHNTAAGNAANCYGCGCGVRDHWEPVGQAEIIYRLRGIPQQIGDIAADEMGRTSPVVSAAVACAKPGLSEPEWGVAWHNLWQAVRAYEGA